MKRYKLIHITNNIEEYPEDENDTLEYPNLIDEVEDEEEHFIIDLETGEYFPARDFFLMVDLEYFYVE